MNIGSGNGYPAAALSNFSPHPFVFDGVAVASMEGLLQAFKFDKLPIQIEVCKLVGRAAKKRGSKKNWQERQTLWWAGQPYARKGDPYQALLDRAYWTMFHGSESFRNALKASSKAVLTHTIGRSDKSETVLTRSEFCSRLTKMRATLL